jgi:hypothetical protein
MPQARLSVFESARHVAPEGPGDPGDRRTPFSSTLNKNMSTEIQKPLSFEEKMMEKIRESIGSLVTDEDLKRIIEKGIDKALFEGRPQKDSWGNGNSTASIVDQAVQKYLSEHMKVAVDAWLANNPDKLQLAIDNAIKLGVAGCVQQSMDQRFSWIFQNLVQSAQSSGLLPRVS